jgi:hypothetical protein
MKRIEYLTTDNWRASWPDDIEALRAVIPEFEGLTDKQIDDIYRDFSDDMWAAGWMGLAGYVFEELRQWLSEDVDATGVRTLKRSG